MKKERLEQYAKELNNEIMKYYLEAFREYKYNKHEDSLDWAQLCPHVMRNFVLLRTDWKRVEGFDGTFIFQDKYTFYMPSFCIESPGMLMVSTAIEVAKRELMEEIINDDGILEDLIVDIADCVKNQDWIIPFLRRKS